jgi:SpoIID/LytB domain protein
VQPELDARYPGTLRVQRAEDGSLGLTLTLSFERYLEGIAEVPPTWPVAALEAQAIAARSYALSHTGFTGPAGGTLGTPICATTDCQVYRGIPVEPTPGIRRWYAAVHQTAGDVVAFDGRPIDAVYFSTSNGHTYGNDQVFGSAPLPYLRPRVERDDGASPTSHWRVAVPFRDLATFLAKADLWPAGTHIVGIAEHSELVVVRGGGTTRPIDAGTFAAALNQWAPCLMPGRFPTASRYGTPLPTTVPSGWFSLTQAKDNAVLTGRGWGHGVGLVQWGAYGKARRGWSATRILAYYYGGLRPQSFPEPGLIHVRVADGLTSLAITPSSRGATLNGKELGAGTFLITGGDQLRATRLTSATSFEGGVYPIGRSLRARLDGQNWHPGCPVPIDDLRLVRVSYWTLDGDVSVGPLVVNQQVAEDVLWVFRRLFRAHFPIHRIGLPPAYRPPKPRDWHNTRNLTSAFNCRPATGNPGSLSQHSYGWAIDVNPLRNPYIGPDGKVLRAAVKPYRDRSRHAPGMIHEDDVVVRSFAAIGWEWGGNWHTLKDYMHFSLTGR